MRVGKSLLRCMDVMLGASGTAPKVLTVYPAIVKALTEPPAGPP